jgi:hypothetical protein
MKQLIIKSAQITANNNAVLKFKGLSDNVVVVKPVGSLLLSLDDVSKSLARIKPDMLVGAVLTVESSTDLQGNTVAGVIEVFKAGDKYTVTSNNSVVKDASINPATNAPYQVGDEAECKTDGVRITGRMNLTLSDSVNSMITNAIISQATANVFAKNASSSSSNRVTEKAQPNEIEETTEETTESTEETVAIEGAENF